MFKLKIKISNNVLIVFYIICIICLSVFPVKYAYDQYIIYKTGQTLKILQDAYEQTLRTTKFVWENDKINNDILANAFVKNLPLKKDCKYSTDDSCFPATINFKRPMETINAKSVIISNYYKVELQNGVGVAFTILDPTCKDVRNRCGTIFIDVNGSKLGPNLFGEDLYDFGIYKTNINLYLLEANHFHRCLNGTGQGCAAYMLKYKNRNYKKYRKIYKKEHTNMP